MEEDKIVDAIELAICDGDVAGVRQLFEQNPDLIKLLEQYGTDLHRVFVNHYTGRPMNALSTAIDWGMDDVAEYLRSKGAVLPPEKD